MIDWYNEKRTLAHFIRLLIFLAILLWISSFFSPFHREVGAAATAKECLRNFQLMPLDLLILK